MAAETTRAREILEQAYRNPHLPLQERMRSHEQASSGFTERAEGEKREEGDALSALMMRPMCTIDEDRDGVEGCGLSFDMEESSHKLSLKRQLTVASLDSPPATLKELLLTEELANLRVKYRLLLASERTGQHKKCGWVKIVPLSPQSSAVQTDRWFTKAKLSLRDRCTRMSDSEEVDTLRALLPACDQSKRWTETMTVDGLHRAYLRHYYPYADLWGEYCSLLYCEGEKHFGDWTSTTIWALNIARDLANANEYHELKVPPKALQSIVKSAMMRRCPVGTDLLKYQEAARSSETLHELCAIMKNVEDLNRRECQALAKSDISDNSPRSGRLCWGTKIEHKCVVTSSDIYRPRFSALKLPRIDEDITIPMGARLAPYPNDDLSSFKLNASFFPLNTYNGARKKPITNRFRPLRLEQSQRLKFKHIRHQAESEIARQPRRHIISTQ